MSRTKPIAEKINVYLEQHNLVGNVEATGDLLSLYEQALRSCWQVEETELREQHAVAVGTILNPFFGPRNVAAALEQLKGKMERELAAGKRAAAKEELKQKMEDPGYVPSFEELMQGREDET